MKKYVVVTNSKGVEVIEASKVTELSGCWVFYVNGKERREFERGDVLVWQEFETDAEVIAFIAELGF